MIIGFGKTETDFEAAEEAAFVEFVKNAYRADGCSYFSGDLTRKTKAFLDARSEELHAKAKVYKTADTFPGRYSYTYPRLISDPCDMVAVVSFHHINRHHGFSPDGWAMLQTKKLFHVSHFDMGDTVQDAA